ncbi:anthranilate 1,2-dioxygenase electron transfer component AntC [Pseudomonas sp. NPDC008258]|uniref:anthranilate 1,2-dioxygenase electron transfer component AntC n=1 Tax=Pseudomonas sp. NPDC008258 TaxID=3364418 RepID=UPI0036EAE07E
MTYKVAFSFADGKTLFCAVQANEILLDGALRSGIKIPLDCREGVCATCQGRCESGQYTQDYVDDEALSASDLAERKVLTCQTRVQSDAAFYFDFDSSLCGASGPSNVQGVVSRVQLVSPSTAILHVAVGDAGKALDYLPGQYARLLVPGTEERRSYSFACAPGSSTLQFLIRLLPSGVMTDYVRDRCQVGDVIHMEAPLGAFYLRHVERPLVMVAGGTGLSAFLGMLDLIAEQGGCGHPVHLYYGVRDAADLCEIERIQAYALRIPEFRFTPVVSEPVTAWSGKTGFIAEHLEVASLMEVPFDLYLCGPPPMVESIKTWRQTQGLEHCRLYLEKFTESNS